MTLDDAEAFAVAQGWAKFRGEQIWRWVHAQGARSVDEMTNLNRETRERVAELTTIGSLTIAETQTGADGTRKLRLLTRDGQSIERAHPGRREDDAVHLVAGRLRGQLSVLRDREDGLDS